MRIKAQTECYYFVNFHELKMKNLKETTISKKLLNKNTGIGLLFLGTVITAASILFDNPYGVIDTMAGALVGFGLVSFFTGMFMSKNNKNTKR